MNHASMAAAGVVALDVHRQVGKALQAGAFDHLAPLLDDLELQVGVYLLVRWAVGAKLDPRHVHLGAC